MNKRKGFQQTKKLHTTFIFWENENFEDLEIFDNLDPIQELKKKYLNHQEFDYSEDLSTWMK